MTKAWTDHIWPIRSTAFHHRRSFVMPSRPLREHPSMPGVLGVRRVRLQDNALEDLPPWEMPNNLRWEARPWASQDDLACCDWLQHQ